MGKQNDHFIIILDLDKVFSSEDLAVVQDVSGFHAGGNSKESVEETELEEAIT